MTIDLEFKIYVDSHVVKKNNRPIWRNRPGKSNKLILAEQNMLIKLIAEKNKILQNFKIKFPIEQYVNVSFCFYFTQKSFYTKQNEIKKTLPDLSNLYQLPEDILQKAEILKNDHYIASHNGSGRFCDSNAEKDYLIIKIRSLNED